MIFDVYEALHMLNKSLYEATLYLEAISRTGAFDTERIEGFVGSVGKVRSETNSYLAGIIQQVEARNCGARSSEVA